MLTDKDKRELITELRNLTFRGMMDCKKHLVKTNWDIKEAEKSILSSNESFALRDGVIWR